MAAPKNIELLVPSISWVFAEQQRTWLNNYQLVRGLWRKTKHEVNWIKWRFLHHFFSQKCLPMKSDSEICCKITSNDLKNCQMTRSYPNYAPKQVRDWYKLDILLCSSVTKRKGKLIFMPRMYDTSKSRRNPYQRVDPKQCSISTRLGRKFVSHTEAAILKSKFINLCLKITPNLGLDLWTVLTSLWQKAMPIQEEEKA